MQYGGRHAEHESGTTVVITLPSGSKEGKDLACFMVEVSLSIPSDRPTNSVIHLLAE